MGEVTSGLGRGKETNDGPWPVLDSSSSSSASSRFLHDFLGQAVPPPLLFFFFFFVSPKRKLRISFSRCILTNVIHLAPSCATFRTKRKILFAWLNMICQELPMVIRDFFWFSSLKFFTIRYHKYCGTLQGRTNKLQYRLIK